MRIALVVFGDLIDRSGGFRYDDHLRRVLTARGHHVTVVSQPDGLSYHRQFTLARGEWIGRVVAATPDLVLVDELNHAATAAGMGDLHGCLPGVPVVAVVHHLRTDERWGRLRARLTERAFLRGCDAWLCNSSVTLQRVRKLSGVRRSSAVVFPATDGGTETPPAHKDPADGAGCRLIFVGNLIPRKNVHRLIRAVREIPGVRLDIYGSEQTDPRYTRRLQRLIAAGDLGERVEIHGRVSDAVLADSYRRADLFAAPSTYEGFGIVYLEALSHGVRVIAGRRGGAVEIVTSDDAGALVTPRVRPIVRAIREVCGAEIERGDATRAAVRTDGPASPSVATRRHRRIAAWRRSRDFPTWTETMTGAAHFLETIVSRLHPYATRSGAE